jgi:tRNA (guanine37-N1)-methyltransferase
MLHKILNKPCLKYLILSMRIDILTILPDLLHSPFSDSIMKRAQTKGHLELEIHNIRDYSTNKHNKVDDYQYGGGAGMVMSIEPIAAIIEKLQSERTYDEIIFMTPDGELLEQSICNDLSLKGNIMILCGHYKGVDERIREHYITREISIGSYVLSGGELGAAVLVDSVVRLIPGVLNDETSALTDSFQDGLLSPPVYTRPPEYNGMKVPEVLLSGDFGKIDKWREEKALERTKARRPDLLD